MALHFDIITVFPEMFSAVLGESIVGRARQAGLVEFHFVNPRDFTTDRHRSVDDRPYGGGPGMVFKPEPVFEAVEAALSAARAVPERTRKLILTPRGKPLSQKLLREFSRDSDWILLLCGHYEGFDERVFQGLGEQGFEELSIGDFVLSGGELPAMAIVDGVTRLLPGALGHPESAHEESFESGLLDFPQYTRPPEFRGMKVPEVLLSGNHAEIADWRRQAAWRSTRKRRPDLMGSVQAEE